MLEEKSSLYQNRDFMLLFFGGLASRIGNGIHYIALTWYVLELTGSGSATGLILLISTLPGVLVGPLGGIAADRINRKILICGMDFLRGIAVLGLGFIVQQGEASFFQLGIVTFILAVSGAFFNPALSAIIPNLVRDANLEKANSLENISNNFTQIIGAALGGILIGVLGFAGAFFFNGISFIISGISELFINIPAVKKAGDSQERFSLITDFKEGFSFLVKTRELFVIFSFAIFLNFLFNGLYAVGIPYVFNEIFQTSSTVFGLAKSAFPAGAILGSILINYYVIKDYQFFLGVTILSQSFLLMSMGIPVLPVFLAGTSPGILILFVVLVMMITGTCNAITNVPVFTLFHRLIPDELRGRVFGLFGAFSQGLTPISMALVGFLMDIVPAHLPFLLGGGLAVLVSLSIFRIPELENLNQHKTQNTAVSSGESTTV